MMFTRAIACLVVLGHYVGQGAGGSVRQDIAGFTSGEAMRLEMWSVCPVFI